MTIAKISLKVVINGPLAAAGSICIESNRIGTKHPNKQEKVIAKQTLLLIIKLVFMIFKSVDLAINLIYKKLTANTTTLIIKPITNPFLNSF